MKRSTSLVLANPPGRVGTDLLKLHRRERRHRKAPEPKQTKAGLRPHLAMQPQKLVRYVRLKFSALGQLQRDPAKEKLASVGASLKQGVLQNRDSLGSVTRRLREAHRTSAILRRQKELADTEVAKLKAKLRSQQDTDEDKKKRYVDRPITMRNWSDSCRWYRSLSLVSEA